MIGCRLIFMFHMFLQGHRAKYSNIGSIDQEKFDWWNLMNLATAQFEVILLRNTAL